MGSSHTSSWVWFVLGFALIIAVAFGVQRLQAQDAQAEATARAVQDRAAAQATAKKLPAANNETKADDKAPAANPEALKRRAGERVGEGPRGQALILGMAVQEAARGGVQVVEVTAASPAFEAGIRANDEIVSFGEFEAASYRKWIDGIRHLVTAADDNTMLPIVLTRGGERVEAQIRVPESHTGASIKLPLGPLPQQDPQQPPVGGPVVVPLGGGGNNVFVDNIGPFGNFFGDASSPARERAMAELTRVGQPQTAAPQGRGAAEPGAGAPPNAGMRIGMAGFRDDPNGMVVMVDVGALPAGNYVVGLSDASIVGGQTAPGSAPPVRPPVGAPAPPAANGAVPQSNSQPVGPAEIPKSVLAQVADTAQPARKVGDPTIPPTGQVNPLTAPPTGQVNPTNTTPTGQSTVNNALQDQADRANAARAAGANNGPPMVNQIGTLTVDQSGTGRMQKTVGGLHVQDVVGQAIVLYSQANAQPTTLPANLNPTIDPVNPQAADAPPNAPTRAIPGAGGLPATGSPAPVAAGIIRLMSDRRPTAPNQAAPNGVSNSNQPIQQPANNPPPVGSNPLR